MIRPLDLQVLYMNLDKIGKEQMNSKEAVAVAQANEIQKLEKEHDEGSHAVGRAEPSADIEGQGVTVDPEGGGEGPNPGPAPRRRPAAAKAAAKDDGAPAWKDPRLGRHVDLSG